MTQRETLRSASGERRNRCSIRCLCGVQVAVGAQLWCRVLWWTLFAGSWWLVEPACGETQEEQLLGVSRGNVSDLEFDGTC